MPNNFTDVKTLFLDNKEVKSIVIDETDGGIIYERTTTPIVLSAGSSEIDYGQNVILNGSISFDTNSIKIYQNDVLIGTTFSSNGVFSYTVSNLNAGTYTFKAVFEGDENHVEGESNGVIVTVNKETPILTLSSDKNVIHYNETITLNGTTTVNGTIKIWQRGMLSPLTSIESVNGTFSYTFTNERQATRQVYATIDATNNYNQASSNTVTLTYSNSTNLTIEVPTLVYSDIFDVTGILTDENNNPIPNASIKLYRDTSILEATATTNNNGEVTFHRSAPTSITTYTFQLIFDGDSSYSNSSSSVVTRNVNAETTILNLTSPLNNATYNEGATIPITGTITTDDGEQLSSELPLIVTVYDENNNRLTLLPIINGAFSGNITAPSSTGNHSITVRFGGASTVPRAPNEEPQEPQELQEPQLMYAPSEATRSYTVISDSITPNSLTLNASKTILSSADAFKNWTQPFNMGIDEENGLTYLTATGSGVVLTNLTLPSEFIINYKFKTTANSTSNTGLLFTIGTDVNNGVLIGHDGTNRRGSLYTRVNGSNTLQAYKNNIYNHLEWIDVNIQYENNIISITMNDETISYTLSDSNLIQNYIGVYGSGASNVRIADFEIIDLSDDSIVYSSSENTSTEITATVLDENDNPCSDKTVTFHLGLYEIQRTTDNDGVATYTYEGKDFGNIEISATLDNLSDSIIIEDCTYYNDGSNTNGLSINSGVSCSSDGEWITISTSTSGEKFVFPPRPLCCYTGNDNWELSFKCKTSDYSGQAFGLQMENCSSGSYSGDSQYTSYSGSFNNCMGAGYVENSLLDTDIVTFKRLNGYWKILKNNTTEISSISYNWSDSRVPGFYTNNGRVARLKEIKYKKIISNPNSIVLTSDKMKINGLNNESCTLSALLESYNSPIANKTVIFKIGDIILGEGTTDENGIATYVFEENTIGDYNITCEYNSIVSNSLNITVSDGSKVFYYNSGADINKVSDFDIANAWMGNNSTKGTITVESDGEEWITIARTNGSNYAHIPIAPLTATHEPFKLSCIVELIAYGNPYVASYSGFYACRHSGGYGYITQWGYPFRMCRNDKGSSDNWSAWTNDGNVTDGTYKYEVKWEGANWTHTLYDLNGNVIKTRRDGAGSADISTNDMEFGIHLDNNRRFRIKEIIAEYLD